MAISGYHAAAKNLVSLCVDQTRGAFKGRLYCYYAPEPIPFDNRQQAFDIIESLCNALNYPQQTQQAQSLWGKKPKEYFTKGEMKRCMSKDELIEKRGDSATFLVHVMYRQNATWQGSVTWADKKQSANFRSALELIKLIDAAVEESGLPEERPQTDTMPDLTKEAEEEAK